MTSAPTLTTIPLSADAAWTEGLAAFVVLVVLQLLVSWSTSEDHGERTDGLRRAHRCSRP